MIWDELSELEQLLYAPKKELLLCNSEWAYVRLHNNEYYRVSKGRSYEIVSADILFPSILSVKDVTDDIKK